MSGPGTSAGHRGFLDEDNGARGAGGRGGGGAHADGDGGGAHGDGDGGGGAGSDSNDDGGGAGDASNNNGAGAGAGGDNGGGGSDNDNNNGNGAGASAGNGNGAGSGHDNDNGAGGDSNDGGDDEDPAKRAMEKHIDQLWGRTDRAKWTGELGRAHAALARGRDWGIEWARLGQDRIDWCNGDGGPEIRGNVGGRLPAERVYADGVLSRPHKADWSVLAQLNEKNGLLQVMALLLWWGDYVGDGEDVFQYVDWRNAVEDVTWVLRELETSGLITGEKAGVKRKRVRAKAAGGPPSQILRRSTRHDKADEGRQTRAKASTSGEKGKGKGPKKGQKRGV
ncbi:hypothetical protein C8F04DRAFT_1183978 [Mycena alexandri]|uniref:Uncharacterized protein n=1 Tax=Mycena alexandri TaxID=1745969 RepID=A0AAD6X3I4_9AGAR|nr:hypothetical protein C8F04DRAFT_1183978 [Mycena alexandri]